MALNVTYMLVKLCMVTHLYTHTCILCLTVRWVTGTRYYPCMFTQLLLKYSKPFPTALSVVPISSLSLSLYPPFPPLFALHLSHSLPLSLFPFFICSFSLLTPFPSIPHISISPSPLPSHLHLPAVVALQPLLVAAEMEQAADWLAG